MTAQTIATAKIKIRPDFTGFKPEVDGEVDQVTAKGGTVKITADTAEAKAKAEELRLRLDQLRADAATVRVKLDGNDKAQSQLDRIDFSLRRLGVTTAKPNIRLEGVERANIQLDELEAKLALIGRSGAGGAGGGGRTGGGGAGGGGFLSRLLGNGFLNPSGLGAAVAFGAPLAVPLAGAGLGALAGGGAAAALGGVGIGAFGLAAKSSVTQVDKDVEALEKIQQKLAQTPATTTRTRTTQAATTAQLNAAQARLDAANARLASAEARGSASGTATATASVASADAALQKLQARGGTTTTTTQNKERIKLLQQEKDLLAKMDPQQRQAAKNIEALDDAWKNYQKALQPQTFAVLADGAKLANTGLGYLLPTAKAVGTEVDDLAKRAEKAFTAPFWHQFFGEFLPGEAARSVDALGTTLGHLATGGAHLLEDFAPLAHRFETDMAGLAGKFEAWSEGSGPGKFVAFVEKEGPVAARALGGLASGLEGLGKGLAPIGQVELEALTPVLDFIGAVGKQHPEVITALGAAYLSVAGGLKAIALVKGLGGLVGVVGALGRGKAPTGVGGSGGGILGRLGAQGSTIANPLYVFVVDKAPGSGPPVIPKTKGTGKFGPLAGLSIPLTTAYLATQGGDEAPDQALGLGGASSVTKAVALALRAYSMHNDVTKLPKVDQQLLGAAVSTNNAGQTHVNVQAATEFLKQYDPKTLDALAQKYPQVAAAIQQANKQVSVLNQYLVTNTGLATANARAVDAQRAALQRELSTLSSLPTYLKDAQAAATSGGFVIGKNLDSGIILGLQQGADKVNLTAVSVTKGTLHAISKTAELGSPSKITTQYGRFIAEGLAVGFTGYQADLLKAFSQSTQVTLDKLGLQLNTAATKYRTDLQSRADLKSSIAGTLFGAADIGNAVTSNTGGASLTGFLGGQLATDKRLEALVTAARRRGLDPQLIEQAVNAGGQQGIALLTQALSGGAAGIKTLDAQEKALGAVTQAIGGSVSTGVFAPTLAKDQRNLDHIAAAIEHFVGQRLRLDRADMQQFARDIAREFAKVFPTLNLKELDKALGIKISGGG